MSSDPGRRQVPDGRDLRDFDARWRADAGWATEKDMVGMSQVESYEKNGLTASGTATFARAWNTEAESIEGSFEVSCEA